MANKSISSTVPPQSSATGKVFHYFQLVLTLVALNGFSMIYNILQAIAYLFFFLPSHVLPSHRNFLLHQYRRIQDHLAYSFSGLTLVLLEWKSGLRPLFYGDTDLIFCDKPIENALLMSNHTSFADWVMLYSFAYRHGNAGALRFFLKDLARFLPGIGWACYFHEFFLVSKRQSRGNWQKDGSVILDRFNSFKASGNNIWPTIFPEGTFHDGAVPDLVTKTQEFAKNNNLQVLDYILTPRTRGFLNCVLCLREQLTHVIDITIAFTGKANEGSPVVYNTALPLNEASRVLPDITDLASTMAPGHVHIHINVTPMKDMPLEEEALKTWLHKRWGQKEELLAYFHKHQAFPTTTTVAEADTAMAKKKQVQEKPLDMFGSTFLFKHVLEWTFYLVLLCMALYAVPNTYLAYGGYTLLIGAITGIIVHVFFKDA